MQSIVKQYLIVNDIPYQYVSCVSNESEHIYI